ncbi:hypothetical protein [Methylobacterium sp. WL9]|uniref:hypothetical protein n=1 Tax=Methylobacterium sp. WL9 TaxID=2603898 RepID=UPI001FEF0234|nr:hypothetical protein [Methylobacterium sp. WL9]
MQRHAVRPRGASRPVPSRCLGAMLLLAGLAFAGSARAQEAPITSLQDAACRAEAKARVFSIPDPLNLGLREIGKQLYFGCMKRSTRPARHAKTRRHRRR